MRAGMAQVAVPQNQRGVGFEHLQGVFTLGWFGHLFKVVMFSIHMFGLEKVRVRGGGGGGGGGGGASQLTVS